MACVMGSENDAICTAAALKGGEAADHRSVSAGILQVQPRKGMEAVW